VDKQRISHRQSTKQTDKETNKQTEQHTQRQTALQRYMHYKAREKERLSLYLQFCLKMHQNKVNISLQNRFLFSL